MQDELLATREAYRFQATHDSLTGLWSHGEILSAAERELARARRKGTSVGYIMADLDYFKKINDTFGHQAGDAVLRETARRLSESVRSYDFVGRYGGEEFLIVVPDCDIYSVLHHAERLRASISTKPIETPEGPVPVTLSLGVVSSKDRLEQNVVALLREADRALYRAKAQGRNRVELAAGVPEKATFLCGV